MRKIVCIFALVCITMTAMAQDKYTFTQDVPYIHSADASAYQRERCKLDVYSPKDKKGFKTLIWFHGGGLEGGSKDIPNELKNSGFAIVAPNYRLFPQCKCPEYIQDAAASVAWVFKHINEFGGDASQIYVSGHSAGGYLALMLALDKSYLAEQGIDADDIKGYYPVSGQCATHYTIRKERKISLILPIVDEYAPLNKARKMGTTLVLITGDRKLEMMSRYEENLYLKSVLEGVSNKDITIHELSGFDHGTVVMPACELIKRYIREDKSAK